MYQVVGVVVASAALIAIGVRQHKKAKAEQERKEAERKARRATPIAYPNGMGPEGFERVVKKEASSIRRITSVSVDGADVTGTVRTSSGINEWHFTIDFNDYGNLLGEVWISSENSDSSIPEVFSERVQARLRKAEAEQ